MDYFHQQNNDKTIKANEDQDLSFCGGSVKRRFELFLKLFVGLTLTFFNL